MPEIEKRSCVVTIWKCCGAESAVYRPSLQHARFSCFPAFTVPAPAPAKPEAQQIGFRFDRRSKGMSEAQCLHYGKRYAVCSNADSGWYTPCGKRWTGPIGMMGGEIV